MRPFLPSWLLLSALAITACGSEDDPSPGVTPGAGGSGATGGSAGSAGSAGSGVAPNCRPRCEVRATTCGLSATEASKLCSQLCVDLTLAQLTCLETSSCEALNDGSALVACGISGSGGAGGSAGAGGASGAAGTAGSAGTAGAGGNAGDGGAGGSAGAAGGGAGGSGQGGSIPENTPELCGDGADNDGDKFTDCNDFDCCKVVDCKTIAPDSSCAKQAGGAGGAGGAAGSAGDGGAAGSAGDGGAGGSAGTGGAAGGGAAGVGGGGAGGSGQSGSGGSAGSTGGSGGAATIQPGDLQKILLNGTVLGPSGPFAGQVLVEGQKITCVEPGSGCASSPGAAGATVITTNGIISPGLIDMHNHILFDIFDGDDWTPEKAYTNHNQWTQEVRYGAMLDVKQCFEDASQGKPAWCPAKWDGSANHLKCEMNKWGETKGLVAGTTSIIGLIGTISGCVGSLARSLGTSYSNLDEHAIQSSALVPSTGSACKNLQDGSTKSYVIHTGEGTDAVAKGQFEKLRNLTDPPGCFMAPQTVITHGTAFNEVEFKEMGEKGMKLVWSPRSNISLYGDTPVSTTNIPLARSLGVLVSLGPDWSMGGSVNMLDEMRFADAWDNKHWNNVLSPKDLFEMATINAAKSLALDDQIGSIQVGRFADLFVFGGDAAAPYDALLGTYPSGVRLVMVGGRVLYGDTQLKPAALAAGSCEDLQVCNASKFICVAESNSSNKLNQTLNVIQTTLEEALQEVDAIPTATKGHSYTFAPLAPLATCP